MSVNVELDNWSYDALERFALAGFIDISSLSTRPITRFQVADKIADIVLLFQDDEFLNSIPSEINLEELDNLLSKLIDEYREELVWLGIGVAETSDEFISKNTYRIIDYLETKKIYAWLDDKDTLQIYNKNGWRLRDGINLRVSLHSWARIGDYIALDLKPFALLNKDEGELDLEKAYVKLGIWNLDIELGRDSLWWGPGVHGAMLISNNAFPLNLIKLSNIKPFYYPGFLKKLGKSNVVFFLAELEEKRDFPNARLVGLRFEFNPKDYLTFGLNRTAVFGGDGRPSLSLTDYWHIFLASGKTEFVEDKSNSDQKASFDMSLRVGIPQELLPLVSVLEIYGEWAGEDRFAPWENEAPGFIAGGVMQDIFSVKDLNLRIEYAKTKRSWYVHGIYTSGYRYKGDILGHHMGTDANDLFFGISGKILDKYKFNVVYDREKSGLTNDIVQKRDEFDIKVLFLEFEELELSLNYNLRYYDNFNNVAGSSSKDYLFEIDVKKNF